MERFFGAASEKNSSALGKEKEKGFPFSFFGLPSSSVKSHAVPSTQC